MLSSNSALLKQKGHTSSVALCSFFKLVSSPAKISWLPLEVNGLSHQPKVGRPSAFILTGIRGISGTRGASFGDGGTIFCFRFSSSATSIAEGALRSLRKPCKVVFQLSPLQNSAISYQAFFELSLYNFSNLPANFPLRPALGLKKDSGRSKSIE